MKSSNKDFSRLANIFVLVSMSMVLVMLTWNATLRIDNFDIHQAELAEQCVNAAADEVDLLVGGYRRAVRIFAEENDIVLSNVALWPQDIEVYTLLKEKVDKYFPDNFTFTLANSDGDTRLEGFEGLIGKSCRTDISTLAINNNEYQTYMHGAADVKLRHFDIMSFWKSGASEKEVFFISFKPDNINRILKNTSVVGHQLVLLRQNTPGLVEISDNKNLEITADGTLAAEAMARISHTVAVPGTLWDAVILPEKHLYRDAYRSILLQSVLIFFGFLVISIIMRTILLDEK